MTDQARKRAFWVCTAIIAAVVAALSAIPPRGASEGSDEKRTRPVVVAGGGAPVQDADREGAEAAARSFLRDYLRYEVGGADRRLVRRLRDGMTTELATRLLAVPPRRPEGPAPVPGRVTRLRPGEALAGSTVFVAEIDREGLPGTLTVTLQPWGQGWKVTDLG